jgi:hypothetical protein
MEDDVDPFENDQTLLDKVAFLQNGLIAQATGSDFAGGNQAYLDLRRELGTDADIKSRLPEFVRRCRGLREFWSFIQAQYLPGTSQISLGLLPALIGIPRSRRPLARCRTNH